MATSRRDFVKATLAAGVGMTAGRELEAQAGGEASLPAPDHGGVLSDEFTRGVGVYPGAPAENFGPRLVPGTSEHRNLALFRPAYHSSSYDYNLTAQLVTDGIMHDRLPRWVSVSIDGKVLAKQDREVILDHFESSLVEVIGARPVLEFHLGGGESLPKVDRIQVFLAVPSRTNLADLHFTAYGSPDGRAWTKLGSGGASQPLPGENYPPDLAKGNALITPSIRFADSQRWRFYRLECEGLHSLANDFYFRWNVGEVGFYFGTQRVDIGGPYDFTSAWKSAGLDEEWVYVDLGTPSTIDRVTLHWIAAASAGQIQVSSDAKQWRGVAELHGAKGAEEIHIRPAARGRYVRALLTRPATAHGYILSEFEIHGRGGLQAKAVSAPQVETDGRQHLAGGAWRVQRADQTGGSGETLSRSGFSDSSWMPATVPGTVLTSYFNAGAVPDPNFGENQLHISDSYFYSDFWYRTEFYSSAAPVDDLQWLEFEGINWKANVFLNGERLGRIEGAFQRARYNVTGKLKTNEPNALAVLIEKNATPGSAKQKTFENPGKNGGALGADNPTFHSSVGWDWIPTIRGRNTGIWNSVNIRTTSTVAVVDPAVVVTLPLPDISRANVTVSATVANHGSQAVAGVLSCRFGDVVVEQPVDIAAGESKAVVFSPASHPQLTIGSPRLWWPAGYGEPFLHDVEIIFKQHAGVSSRPLLFKAGIRQITASEEGGALKLWVNGRRIVAKGGNWGFSESMLRYRAREYDAAVRYHREMNFNMIRNWVGQIGEDAFYEACDRHGVLVWQDFWLANPWDGPVPNDNEMFLKNARDLVLRIRPHACIGIYCGRNEWFPPKPLEEGLRALLQELHADLHYIGSSADGPVSGHGPYQALPPETYFRTADTKLHSEIGSPNIPSYESLQLMMPKASQWPQALDWGLHDFCLKGAQGGDSFRSIIDENYGGAASAEEWVKLAQFVNYDTYRAMFEAQGKNRMGLLLWMSHPCWPSFVWQTYDYFLEPTAAYFACKKACEPIHIQHNPLTGKVEIVNASGGNQEGLLARAQIIDDRGRMLGEQSGSVNSREDSLQEAFAIEYPGTVTDLHFLRLILSRAGVVVSQNFYLRGRELANYRSIRALPFVHVSAHTEAKRAGAIWRLTTKVKNTSASPALMVRIKAVRARSRDRILPAIFSDNYVSLMPGEEQILQTELQHTDTRGEEPQVVVDGYNIASSA